LQCGVGLTLHLDDLDDRFKAADLVEDLQKVVMGQAEVLWVLEDPVQGGFQLYKLLPIRLEFEAVFRLHLPHNIIKSGFR
jgi:hypothetical protein